jgi:hypothetical protein
MSGYGPGGDPTHAGSRALLLSSNRQRVLTELQSLSSEAAEIYESALWVLEEPANPKRARLAAGAMRELLAELSKNAGVVRTRGLKARVFELHEHWQKVDRSEDRGIEGETVRIAGLLDLFFGEVKEEYPTKREGMTLAARGLDAIGGSISPDIEGQRVKTLMDIDGRFNNALHGSSTLGVAEVEREIDRFGDFLLSLRRPPMAEDLNAIDNLLEKGPPNG